jgi:apolipoprotein D and lipocalin family protein
LAYIGCEGFRYSTYKIVIYRRAATLRNVKINYWIIILAVLLMPFAGSRAVGDDMGNVKTVQSVDLERYMGTWYEIAKIPNWFQRKCTGNVSANYTLNADGTVEVINSCLEENGDTDTARGIAKVEDAATNAKLKVSFVSFLGIRLFWGDYWILYLDDEYQNAVVGEPSRKYGWILNRKKELTPEELEPIYKTLRENGYRPEEFITTVQNIKD